MSYKKQNKLHIVVASVIIKRPEDGKFLIIKRAPHEKAFPNRWSFPGGKVEDNKTVWETLVDEAKEEVNLRLKPGKVMLKDATFIRPDNQTVKVFSYLCEAKDISKIKLSRDFTEYKWVTAQELRRLPHVGIFTEAKKADEILKSKIPISLISTKSERPWGNQK